MKKALITGINGQDGSYLAELLLKKGYDVYGMHRRGSTDGHLERIDHLKGKINLVCGDLTDGYSIDTIVKTIKPDEVYNLAAQSQVALSFKMPYVTNEINKFGTERLLGAVLKHVPNAKFYQASTSELFGKVSESPQSESTPFNPVSPYAESKLDAHKIVGLARENGLFACCGILFNHESPRRGLEFVTRKLTDGIARFKLGVPQRETGKEHLEMGNLTAKRDWGYAKDYVEAMWLMLQQDIPEDYIVATGQNHTIKEFAEKVAEWQDMKITWQGEGVDEKGYVGDRLLIAVNPEFFRPAEVHNLLGDSSKTFAKLGWKPTTDFNELTRLMIDGDIAKIKKEYNL